MPLDYKALAAPFPPDEIEWRVGSTTQDKKKGMALAYIDARAVMDRLDAVVGPNNWQCRYTAVGDKTCCEIGIQCVTCESDESDHGSVCFDWVWKSDGAGDTDFEGAKGAFSDAFKRAAVRWGIGRYLYDVKAPWVEIEARGKSFIIPDRELATLRRVLEGKSFTPSPPSNAYDPNWKGPLTKTKLGDELKAFCTALADSVHMPEELDNLVDEYHAVLTQAASDLPLWMNGPLKDAPSINERIEAKRKFLGAVNNLRAG